ncbi:MAG TPA: SdpI family protein [Candidatus Bilamarchaeum sp.]|nr:SdpI family protein [Candidatus Bilamarchaeum sp.]
MIELKAIALLVVISFAVGAYAYPHLPGIAVSHWNASGEADGYMPREYAAFLLPAISGVLALVFLAVPMVDPLRANIESFKKAYFRFCIAMLLFLLLVHAQAMLWNLGTRINFNLTMPVLLGGLIFYLGSFLAKAKQNWSIGIRTPWTLSSTEVWAKTHRLGSKLFMAAGALCLLSALIPEYSFIVIFGSVASAALASVAYSYLSYARLHPAEPRGGRRIR